MGGPKKSGIPPVERFKNHIALHRTIYKTIKSKDLALAKKEMKEHSLEVEYGLTRKRRTIKPPRLKLFKGGLSKGDKK
jgi:DNA-binding FadR family transcriptional regulator